MDAPAATSVVQSIFDWHNLLLIAGGMFGQQVLTWLNKWLSNQGADFVKVELEKIKTKLNENSVLGQFHADDAVVNILESEIPVVMQQLSADESVILDALKSGNMASVPWKDFASKLWIAAKPQITGGVNDYIQHSSFEDGATAAEMVLKRFFSKQLPSPVPAPAPVPVTVAGAPATVVVSVPTAPVLPPTAPATATN